LLLRKKEETQHFSLKPGKKEGWGQKKEEQIQRGEGGRKPSLLEELEERTKELTGKNLLLDQHDKSEGGDSKRKRKKRGKGSPVPLRRGKNSSTLSRGGDEWEGGGRKRKEYLF